MLTRMLALLLSACQSGLPIDYGSEIDLQLQASYQRVTGWQ